MKARLESTIESPCVRNCCLDQNDVCLGCGRNLDEILEWHSASPTRQLNIIESAELRKSERPS